MKIVYYDPVNLRLYFFNTLIFLLLYKILLFSVLHFVIKLVIFIYASFIVIYCTGYMISYFFNRKLFIKFYLDYLEIGYRKKSINIPYADIDKITYSSISNKIYVITKNKMKITFSVYFKDFYNEISKELAKRTCAKLIKVKNPFIMNYYKCHIKD